MWPKAQCCTGLGTVAGGRRSSSGMRYRCLLRRGQGWFQRLQGCSGSGSLNRDCLPQRQQSGCVALRLAQVLRLCVGHRAHRPGTGGRLPSVRFGLGHADAPCTQGIQHRGSCATGTVVFRSILLKEGASISSSREPSRRRKLRTYRSVCQNFRLESTFMMLASAEQGGPMLA